MKVEIYIPEARALLRRELTLNERGQNVWISDFMQRLIDAYYAEMESKPGATNT